MKNIFTLSLLLVAVMVVSCSGMRKFDRVEATSVERHSIVYKDNKCGLYDIQADSLVTAIKYDALRYGRTASEGGYELTKWVGEMENIDTKKNWASAGLYVMIALVMPIFCLGYNPYSVLEASRAWHFDKYYGSPDGILCVRAGDTGGLRDRYGVILPVDKYNRIELLTPSKPYCKVRKDSKWQIYDIERQELVSDEWFEEVVQCDEYVYRLKSQNGDKYMTIQWYYNRYDKEQSAVISDELPVKIEE